MSNKKEREREELHKTIWKIAEDVRGSVDGWDFKQYVLGLLFYRFISENIEEYINTNQRRAGELDFKYSDISDNQAELGREDILKDKGFFILPSDLFCNIRKKCENDSNLNVTLYNVFKNIENSAKGTASENDVKGLFDDFNVNDNKLGATVEERNEKLSKMIISIGDLNLGNYKENSIDTFGDAYEFLMTMYASDAGKSGGEFFTPQEVGELLARIVIMNKSSVNKVYDPACGSGGLLLKFAKILGKENVKEGFYGQEKNLTTYNLARINMFLHDINYNNFNIQRGDTLNNPKHINEEPFDAIVSNPPYSIHWEGKSNPLLINDERFSPAGVLAPEGYADLAFTMHMLSWLSPTGTAAIVEYPGVLYRKGAEQKIRQFLVKNNYVDTVIQLPGDLFFGTGQITSILVLKKNKISNDILFIDASKEYVRKASKNKLEEKNINNIMKYYSNRIDIEGKTIVVANDEVLKNKSDLSVGVYIKNIDKVEIDIEDVNTKIKNLEKETIKTKELVNKNFKNDVINKLLLKNSLNTMKYMKIGEVCDIKRGKVISKDYLSEHKGEYPVYSSQTLNNGVFGKIDSYAFDGEYVQWTTDGAKAGSVFYRNGKFSVTNVCGLLKIKDEWENKLDYKYLAYILENEAKKHVNYAISNPKLMSNTVADIDIPIPDIQIQRKISQILDDSKRLQEELTEELESRIKEYEFYRNKILDLGELDEDEE